MDEMRRAVKSLNPFRVRELLLAGEDPNLRCGRHRSTAIHECLAASRWESCGEVTVRVLLELGADPNIPDKQGRMPIVDSGTLSMMRLMLEAGADTDVVFGNEPLVRVYAACGNAAGARLLLEFGANPNIPGEQANSIEALLARSLPGRNEAPGQRASIEKRVWEMSKGLTLLPEEYVAKHRDFIVWSFHTLSYENEELGGWATQVAALLNNPVELKRCYEKHLHGEELEDASRAIAKSISRHEKRLDREAMANQYVKEYGLPRAPFKFSHLVRSRK